MMVRRGALLALLCALLLAFLFPFIAEGTNLKGEDATYNFLQSLQQSLKEKQEGAPNKLRGSPAFPTSLFKKKIQSRSQNEAVRAGQSKREKPSLYSLIDGRYPNARSLPSVLASLPDTKEGRKVVQTLLDYFRNKTGYTLPQSWVNLALNNSYGLLDAASLTPTEMHLLGVGANLDFGPTNYSAEAPGPKVPSGFVWPDDIAGFQVNMSNYIPSIAPIGAGLWLGFFFPNTTSLEQAKINVVTSFIFNQLSDNLSLEEDSPNWFILKYNGRSITSVEGFLSEILRQNPSNLISTYVTKRIAAFFGLYVNDQGKWLEVADPLMIATGLYSADGLEEAILPAIHSEWVIDVTTKAGNFNIVWYQGDDGVGFFPGNMYVLESWVGIGNGATVYGVDAVKAINYMSLYGDILRRIYVEKSLFDYGYAVTGVCDDACGAIEILAYGESTEYPNLIIRASVLPEIISRIQKKDRFSSYYYDLLTTVSAIPEDWSEGKDSSAPMRALGTIVWPPGQEPFQCVVDARRILSGIHSILA